MANDRKQEVLNWISELFKDQKVDVIDFKFPDYDTNGGALGDIMFVNVIGRIQECEQIFHLLIKQSKSSHEVLDDLNLRVGYMNEINLYSKILPYFQKFHEDWRIPPLDNLPKCFGTIVRENLYIIAMENLQPKGFRMHALEKPQNLSCAKLVLEAYAKWQAVCMAVKDQKPEMFRVFGENNKDFQRKKMMKLFISSSKKELDFVIGLYKEKGEKLMVQKIEEFKRNFEENFKRSISVENCTFPVIRHGDCWNNNFLFIFNTDESNPKEVVIIDWQNSCLGPPLADIAQYLLFSCSSSIYKNIEELVRFYYDCLSTRLRELGSDPEKCFCWTECFNNFKNCLPTAVFTKPIFVRASLDTKFNSSFDISQSANNDDFHEIFSNDLKDQDEYFRRIDDTFKTFMKKGLI